MEQYEQHNPSRSANLYRHAAATLESCLKQTPGDDTTASRERLGELWMYAGEMEAADGRSVAAVASLQRAADILARLRTYYARQGTGTGTKLDEVLLDSHQADRDLATQFYDIYNRRGNVEATNGNFDAAIADWQQAEEVAENLTTDPDKRCRGEPQRVEIRAARQAKEEVSQGHLTPTQAATWFEKRNAALWIPNPCNRP